MYGYEWMPHAGMGYGMGYGFGWVFAILFWALLIVGIVALVKWLFTSTGSGRANSAHASSQRNALAILEERYARGEIDREDFLARKQDLQG